MYCRFEIDLRGWTDWTRAVPVLIVDALAVSDNQLGSNSPGYTSLPIVYV